eukprot:CAMPEP_0117005264 /NCGR_PEP_ID=MMETSP0472-20121206/5947_1 /TAXON_ID=693140 ORGANISM="Tiarina fusus, Strain LIS" /NCGR_SAMPLE_ID=MMETSP0472 /ASSEMBLY_ACC=CAM_ASM_000603 /LENGTH=305 /DNA_ID=CAMNT_0004706465 /DNA_START=166 /DNA_END=1086 /DNA_ORIENTATION=-
MASSDQIKQAIPARFVMISGSEDVQTSADVFNVGTFELPNPAGKAGGACTSTLLKVLNEHNGPKLSWIDLLHKMRSVLRQKGFDQVPQLSASRLLDVNDAFEIVPQASKMSGGAKRAILIGINYVGQQGQLSGCHNDVNNIKRYLIQHEGFMEKDMLILMDNNQNHAPTKKNIVDAFTRITQYSKAGDCVFIHYSGHGGRVKDLDGDEDDGFDETLIPVDFRSAGQIVDDDIYKMLVKAMPADVNVTVLMDCCHSGTAMDLPYTINATESKMHANDRFNIGSVMNDPAALACCACLAFLLVDGLF